MRVRGSQRRELVPPAPSPPHGPSATLPTVALESIRRVRPPTPRATVAVAAAILLLIVPDLGRRARAPFVLGPLLVYVLDPAVGWLTRRRAPRWLAILLVYAATIVILVEGLSLLFGPLLRQAVAL